MSRTLALREIESHFNTQWAGQTVVGYTNTPFYSDGLAEWTRFSVNFTQIRQLSLGASQSQQRQSGFIDVQFYVPLKQGMNRSNQLLDLVVAMLSGVRIVSVKVGTPNVNIVGETPKWFVSNVTFDFEFDFIR